MQLRIQLRSDSAFGRGDGIAGLVDSEVEHDSRTGLPYIKGRTLKGLLVESCANILYVLKQGKNSETAHFEAAAAKLFGVAGSRLQDTGCLHVGSAHLPETLRQHLLEYNKKQEDAGKSPYTAQQILQAFTTIRHQTAVEASSGKPKDTSLRATRVVLRETAFYAQLHSLETLDKHDMALLAACAAGVKQGGQNRTRGLGWLKVELIDVKDDPLDKFISMIGGQA